MSMNESAALIARDGDVLVVSYPEVKIPLTTKYGIVGVGGLIYTRKLVEGDVVQDEHDKVYAFLQRMAERDAREKVRAWTQELESARQNRTPPPLPPKPAGPSSPKPSAPAGTKPAPARAR
jgi:hypothetical protein